MLADLNRDLTTKSSFMWLLVNWELIKINWHIEKAQMLPSIIFSDKLLKQVT